MRLVYKLFILIVLLSLLPLSFVTLFSYVIARRAIRDEAVQRLTVVSDLEVSEIERWLESNARSLREMAQRPLVRQYSRELVAYPAPADTLNLPVHDALLKDHFDPMIEGVQGFFELLLLNPENGFVYLSTNETQFGKLRADEPYFHSGREETFIQNIYYSLSHDQSLITTSTPIIGDGGQTLAVLAGHINLNELANITAAVSKYEGQDSYLVDSSNFFLARQEDSGRAAFSQSAYSPAIDRCLQGETGSEQYINHLEIPVIGVYRWLPARQLCLLTEIDEAALLATTKPVRNAAIGLGLTAALLTILAASWLAQSMNQPITQLVAGTRAVGSGDLDYRVQIRGQAEIEELAASFNAMAERLQTSRRQLAHDHHLLSTLSQAAPSIQRAQSVDEVFQHMAAAFTQLGWGMALLTENGESETFELSYMAFDHVNLPEAQSLLGIGQHEPLIVTMKPDSQLQNAIKHHMPFFVAEPEKLVNELMPSVSEEGAGQAVAQLDIHGAILAPLIVQGKLFGILLVVGQDLVSDDVPAIATFVDKSGIALQNRQLIAELHESEQKFKNLADEIADGVAVSAGNKIRWVNKAFAEIFGYKPAEMVGQDIQLVISSEQMAALRGRLRQRHKGKTTAEHLVIKASRKDDDEIFVEIKSKEMVFAGETAVQLVVSDITERTANEEALRRHRDELELLVAERAKALIESEKRYRTLAESMPDMVFLIDSHADITYTNKTAAAQFGKRVHEVIGQPMDALFPSDLVAYLKQMLQEVRQTGQMSQAESVVALNGENIWLQTRLVPMRGRDSDGEMLITNVLGIARDITALKETELSLAEKADALEKSNIELQQFAYVASHDLQEPLRMVTSFLDLLLKELGDDLSADARQYIAFAVDGASRMSGLINDLLQFSRVTSRARPFTAVAFEEVVASACTNLELSIVENEVQIATDSLPVVNGDQNQLVRLMQNLLSNAIKFQSDEQPKIHISAVEVTGGHQFSVRDNGIGIDPAYQEKIFVIFQRLHTRHAYEGSGIGLAICKKIVERHGGEIWFESNEDGPGTTFFFTLLN